MPLNTAPSFSGKSMNNQQIAAQPLSSRIANQRSTMRPPMRQAMPRGVGGNIAGNDMGFKSQTAPSFGGAMPGNGMSAASGMNPRFSGGTGSPNPLMSMPGSGPRPGLATGPTPGMRIQAPPLMDAGMIADNAPPMGPPMNPMNPMGNSPGIMAPQSGGFSSMQPEGGEMGNIFGRYPRNPDPRFRY